MNPPRLLEEFQPVHFGHAEIGQDEIEVRPGEQGARARAIFRLADRISERGKKLRQAVADILLVVDDERLAIGVMWVALHQTRAVVDGAPVLFPRPVGRGCVIFAKPLRRSKAESKRNK